MGIIGAAEAQSQHFSAVNKLNASYRQDDYFFFFSFSSYIIYQQHVDGVETVAEADHSVEAQRVS
jgi:hypothetical protein